MTKLRYALLPAVAVALLASGAAAATDAAKPADSAKAHRDCFLSSDWEGWTAPGDGDTLYLKVHLHDYYKVELTPGSHVRKDPDYFLVNRVRGSNWICSPLDLDLTLSDHLGIRQGLIARSIRKLTPEEVAAMPRKDLP